MISDTDHYSPFEADALWAWKSMLRGQNPILYDLGIVQRRRPGDACPGHAVVRALEPATQAMGETRRFAEHVDLGGCNHAVELSSTGYALANPGVEYLVLQPDETGCGVHRHGGRGRVRG